VKDPDQEGGKEGKKKKKRQLDIFLTMALQKLFPNPIFTEAFKKDSA
jgi:hypothetical protein